jgi:hypothetical protein
MMPLAGYAVCLDRPEDNMKRLTFTCALAFALALQTGGALAVEAPAPAPAAPAAAPAAQPVAELVPPPIMAYA